LGGSYYFSDKYVTEQRIVEQEKAQKKIEKNVQEATFDLGSLSSINISAETNPIEQEAIVNQELFSVIAGSFRSLSNAEKKVESLKSEGYPAELAQSNPDGLYRVAYGRYSTKKEAVNMLYFLKYTLEEEAWYLEEK
ncbi:MAG: SPOR domain-containing protein, partial [Burkholderiaceae bacterium]